ncbi:MAG: methyltransferase [Psychrosphaera sp.]|nr:methyltransferase [Psychrosphaera sp.]
MKTLPGKEIACLYDKQGAVRVYDDGNKRYLSFGAGDEQSCMVKASPGLLQYDYNRAMILVMLLCQPTNILVLGLGGGTLPSCLLRHFPEVSITVIELREVVIKIASKYFDLPDDGRLKIINDNALDYLQKHGLQQHRLQKHGLQQHGLQKHELQQHKAGTCDVLFSDLFIAEGLEARQLTERFIENAKRILTDDGYLVINALEEYRTEKVLSTLFGRHFKTIYENITDDGNWVIIATNGSDKVKPKILTGSAKQLSEVLGFSLMGHLKRLV